MPARSERMYIYPGEDGQLSRVMRFPLWWERREFFDKYRQRAVDLGNPFYSNFALLLTGWEAAAWDERCREKFSGDSRSEVPEVIAEMSQLRSMLRDAKWVIVESYEWESGLD